jgi:methionyl aminopeptidase
VNLNPSNEKAEKINKATKLCLENAIKKIKIGNTIGDISHEIEKTAKENGFEVIKDYGGHGCGNKIHEGPMILCHGKEHSGPKIVDGMVLCIEPMIMTDSDEYYVDPRNN